MNGSPMELRQKKRRVMSSTRTKVRGRGWGKVAGIGRQGKVGVTALGNRYSFIQRARDKGPFEAIGKTRMGKELPPGRVRNDEGSGAETAEDREEALHASLVVVTKLDIVTKETHLSQARAGRNHLEATDEILFTHSR